MIRVASLCNKRKRYATAFRLRPADNIFQIKMQLYDLFQNYQSMYMIGESFAAFSLLGCSKIRFIYTLDPDPGSAIFRRIRILQCVYYTVTRICY